MYMRTCILCMHTSYAYMYIYRIYVYISRGTIVDRSFSCHVSGHINITCVCIIYTHTLVHTHTHTHTHTHLAHNVCVLYLDLPTFRTYVSYIFPCIIYIFINTHTHTHTHSPRTCSACEMISHAEIQKNVETPGISKLRMHISYT